MMKKNVASYRDPGYLDLQKEDKQMIYGILWHFLFNCSFCTFGRISRKSITALYTEDMASICIKVVR